MNVLSSRRRNTKGRVVDNDDVAGSANNTKIDDMVLKYGKPREEGTSQDTNERILTVHKNRLNGRTNRDGIRLYFQESSKRISEHDGIFDWELGWEGEDFREIEDEELVFD